jgi:hypothetical protein
MFDSRFKNNDYEQNPCTKQIIRQRQTEDIENRPVKDEHTHQKKKKEYFLAAH